MNTIRSFKYVADLINSEYDIKKQLQILKKYRYRKGVRKYIDNLILANQNCYDEDSKYILYCIVKYYYGLDVSEVKIPISLFTLEIITPADYDIEYVSKLLYSKDDIIDQCKLLKEHKNSKDVQNYIRCACAYYGYDALSRGLNTKYQRYCIDKYYFDLDVKEVKPQICLRAFEPIKHDVNEIYKDVSNATPFSELKKEDKVEILNGPFEGLKATVQNVSKDFKEIDLCFLIFEEETFITLDEDNKMRKIIDDK